VLSFDDGRLRTSSFDASEGFGLRAVQGERVGYAHSTKISEQAMRQGAGTVRLAIQAGGGSLMRRAARHQSPSLQRSQPPQRFELSSQDRHPARD
jgi:TldD protein